MIPYGHVLCPVDFSDVSKLALDWALGFTSRLGARLTVLHVVDSGALGIGNLFAVPDSMEELRSRAREHMEEWRQDLDLADVTIEIEEGNPAKRIAEVAKERAADLLVLGTHGWSGFQRLLLGSVTENVLHRASVPLLTLSPKAKLGEGFKKILVSIDLGEESQAVMRHALWLAEHYQAELIAAHIVPVPYVVLNDRTLQRLSAEQIERLEESLSADRRKQVQALLPETTVVKVDVVTPVGNAFDLLRDTMTEKGVDLVVMGAGGHSEAGVSWLGSTCHKMVRLAPCPVLVVR